MTINLSERRRYIRIEVPVRVKVSGKTWHHETITKNISPVGLKFEVPFKIDPIEQISIKMDLPTYDKTISLKGKIIWVKKVTLEDNSPYDVGAEIIYIEDAHKNFLLRYLCDILYSSDYHSA
ncbi:MAG: PilZ domain-containing protein [Candidatus Omnitrophica bacterium]|nr:PilZ domain-containing protein [Candidatus Omnitrophota bacterium]